MHILSRKLTIHDGLYMKFIACNSNIIACKADHVKAGIAILMESYHSVKRTTMSTGPFNFPFFPAFGGGMEEGARAPRAPVRGYRP